MAAGGWGFGAMSMRSLAEDFCNRISQSAERDPSKRNSSRLIGLAEDFLYRVTMFEKRLMN